MARLECLRSIVKSGVALKALDHVIDRVSSLNSGRFPVYIDVVGLGGSALSVEDVGDVDVVLQCSPRKEFMKEWEMFEQKLQGKFAELWSLIIESSRLMGRATMDFIIKEFYDELVNLGFKDWWIKEWLVWSRVSDFRWAVDEGVLIPYFDEKRLVERYVKYGWHGRRLEVHVKIEGKILHSKIPYVTVWTREKGIVKPGKKELREFFLKEQHELLSLSTRVIKGLWHELPPIYYSVSLALKSKFEIPHYLMHGFVGLCLIKNREIHEEAKKALVMEIKNLKKLVRKQPKRELTKIMRYNRILRNTLKKILAYTYIVNTIEQCDIVMKILSKIRKKTMEEYLSELKRYILRNGVRQGLRKHILEEALKKSIREEIM